MAEAHGGGRGLAPGWFGPLFMLILGMLGAASELDAQTVRGTLRDGSTGQTIPAALVRLERPDGGIVETTLTDPDGRFRFRSERPGPYRVVTRHIGHETVVTEVFDLAFGEARTLELEAGLSPIRVRGVTADPDRNCRTLDAEDATVVAGFWDEARKALEAARWTVAEGGLSYEVEHVFRTLDPDDLSVVDEQVQTRSGEGANPFRSLPAQELADEGYVQGDDVAGRDYFAPDAAVLLSSTFVNAHCFRMDDPGDTSDVRIAFEPLAEGDVPDIQGFLDLDRNTLKLRRLEFGYTRLDLGVSTDELGGFVDFEELITGAWIVRQWAIRMPQIHAYRMRSRRIHKDLVGFHEVGGTVRSVVDLQGRDVRRAGGGNP